MLSADLSVEQLREYLHEISGTVARRLSSVVERARDVPEHKSIPLDRVALEVAGIQRTIMNELVAARPLRREAVAAMLDLELDALKLLDQIENFLWQAGSRTPSQGFKNGGEAQAAVRAFEAASARARSESLSSLTRQGQARPAIESEESENVAEAYVAAMPSNSWQAPVAHSGGSPSYPMTPNEYAQRPIPSSRAVVLRTPARRESVSWTGLLRDHALALGKHSLAVWSVAGGSALLAGAIMVMIALSGDPAATSAEAQPAPVAAKGDKLTGRLARGDDRGEADTAVRKPVVIATAPIEPVPALPTPVAVPLVVQPPPSTESAYSQTVANPNAFVAVIATVAEPPAAQQALNRIIGKYPAAVGAVTQAQVEPVKGTDGSMWYRTYLLPALSQPDAKDLCRRLRRAGHNACWVKQLGS